MKAFVFLLFISFFSTVQAVVSFDSEEDSVEAVVFWAKDLALFNAVKNKKCQELQNALGDYEVKYSDHIVNKLVLRLKEKKQKHCLAEATTQLVFHNEEKFEGSFEVDTVEEVPLKAKFYLYSCSLPGQTKNDPCVGYAWVTVN